MYNYDTLALNLFLLPKLKSHGNVLSIQKKVGKIGKYKRENYGAAKKQGNFLNIFVFKLKEYFQQS